MVILLYTYFVFFLFFCFGISYYRLLADLPYFYLGTNFVLLMILDQKRKPVLYIFLILTEQNAISANITH